MTSSVPHPSIPTAARPRQTVIARLTPGAILAWLIFSFITLTIAIMALPHAGRYYDFRAFYSAGFLLLHHPHQLFDLHMQGVVQDNLIAPIKPPLPFYHPAFEALLYAPLALFTYRSAYILYAAFNLFLLGICYLLAPQPSDPLARKFPRPLLFFLSFPAFFCIAAGQDSCVFLLLLCLVWKALAHDDDIAAGILLGLALFKVQLVAVLVIFLVARRGARLLRSFLPTAAALALLSLAITGFRGAAQWIHLLTSAVDALDQGRHAQVLIAVHPMAMPTLNGLIYILGGRLLPAAFSWILNLVLLGATFIAALVFIRKSSRLPDAFSAAIAAALLLAPHLYLYDYILLIPALLLLTGRLQTLLATVYCTLPFILFAIHGLDWLAPMALLPALMLTSLFLTERSHRLHQAQSEKVTPHPLTAL